MILYLYLKNANVLVHVVFQIDFKLKTILVENRKKKNSPLYGWGRSEWHELIYSLVTHAARHQIF